MFGESDDEDTRGRSSPWDPLLSSSPSLETDLKRRLQSSSRLTPEIEEGNVEYKLKLINPTPERFARLVTQLKWRLLEGGGQAYYELGVADSGQLVGLSRHDLNLTLETLEAMAGEIGASVIIVKEVEVPAMRTVKMGLLADGPGGVDFSQVDGAMRLPRRRHPLLSASDDSERDADAETPIETDPTTDDGADQEDAVRVISMDGRPKWVTARDTTPEDEEDELAFDIEVSSVYKPLPSLRRPRAMVQLTGKLKGAKKTKSAAAKTKQLPKPKPEPIDFEARALERKARRDARREERQRVVNHLDSNQEAAFDLKKLDAALRAAADDEENGLVVPAPWPSSETQPPLTNALADDEQTSRFIIEALVVRKLANNDVFSTLDDYSFLVG